MADSRFADADVTVPAAIRALADGATVQPVWMSGDDAVTFRISGAPERFVKWRPAGASADLHGEARRLRWAGAFAPVPEVLDDGSDASGSWLVTVALPGADGSFVGHVDLGDLGVADRWADLAVGTWSTEWNDGPGWEGRYLQAYDIEPDPERIRFYRNLWDLNHPV